MAWVKSQIWSPDQVKAQGEFVSFKVADLESLSQRSESVARVPLCLDQQKESHREETFNLAPGYWDALMQDPLFRSKFDVLVEEEVRKRLLRHLEKDQKEVLPQIAEEAMRQGYRDGQNLAKEEVEEKINQVERELTLTWEEKLQELDQIKRSASQTFETLLQEWKNERESLMRSHETEWCQAMGHLLKRFQIEKAGSYERALKEWMREAIPDFISQTPITICVSDKDAERVKMSLGASGPSQLWNIVVDAELKEGQIRFEAGKGGALFDSQNNFEKLFKWLEIQA